MNNTHFLLNCRMKGKIFFHFYREMPVRISLLTPCMFISKKNMKYGYRVTIFFCLSIGFFFVRRLEHPYNFSFAVIVHLLGKTGSSCLPAPLHTPARWWLGVFTTAGSSHKLLWSFACWNPANHLLNLKTWATHDNSWSARQNQRNRVIITSESFPDI